MLKRRSLGTKIKVGAAIGFILLTVIGGIIGNQAYVLFIWLFLTSYFCLGGSHSHGDPRRVVLVIRMAAAAVARGNFLIWD